MRAKRELFTVCADCGNPSVPHNDALWTTSEDAYCTKCRPMLAVDTITWLRAEMARKDAALRAIADQSGCGCKPVCHCNDSVSALYIYKEWAIETARAALTAQEKTDADDNS